jgi:hypothetical protein
VWVGVHAQVPAARLRAPERLSSPRDPEQPVRLVDELRHVVGLADQPNAGAVITEHHAHRVVADVVDIDAGPIDQA